MLQAYLPALVFLFLGVVFGGLFAVANGILGPNRPNAVKQQPYESGIPSNVGTNFRFGISFYLTLSSPVMPSSAWSPTVQIIS